MSNFTWTQAAGGNWNASSNWTGGSSGASPGSAATNDSVALLSSAGLTSPYTVRLTANVARSIANLTVNDSKATLALNTNSANLANTGTTVLQAGTIDITAAATLKTAAFLQSGGAFNESAGSLKITNTFGTAFAVSGGAFQMIGGAVALSGGSTASFSNAADLISNASISGGTELDIGAGSAITFALNAGTVGAAEVDVSSNATVVGTGRVGGTLSGFGTVEASGGTLALTVALGPSSNDIAFEVDSAIGSVLEVDGNIGTATTGGHRFSFLNGASSSGELFYNGKSSIAANGTLATRISGLNVVTGGTPTDFIRIGQASAISILSGQTHHGTSDAKITFTSTGISGVSSVVLANTTGNNSGTWFVRTQADSHGGTDIFLSSVCFAAGTRILTIAGERAVESITRGDIVLALVNGEPAPQLVNWVGRRHIDVAAQSRPERVAPVRIRRDAFADNVPHADLLLSPDHAVFVDGKLICARQLINGTTICQELHCRSVDYHHIELERHAILLSEGLPTESYLDTGNRGFFANAGAALVLHPDLTDESDFPTREAGSCAPFVWDAASVLPIWQRLAERATAIGQPVPRRDTTAEPELRLLADGRRAKPLYSDSARAIFMLPANVSEVRLLSRAQSPTDARAWLEDRRRLGVRIARIALKSADETREVPIDHPGLVQGWWGIERDGTGWCRWTDGDAVLPLPPLRDVAMLEIHFGGAMTYLLESRLAA